MTAADTIDRLSGLAPDDALVALRARRAVARDQAEASFSALFTPAEVGDFPLADRFLVAAFVAALHGDGAVATFHAQRAEGAGAAPSLIAAVFAVADRGKTQGPYGSFPAGPLSVEDQPGPRLQTDPAPPIGPRLAAALDHTHMLVFHPRDAAASDLRALEEAGWSADAIVTLSQLVAFLTFQLRLVHGLRVLRAARESA